MRIVNVKCPGCGASIQLDADRDTGFCSFCGSTVKVQEAIQKIKFDNSDLIKNYLVLAEAAFESKEFDKCIQFADKALAADSKNKRAWLIKLKGYSGYFLLEDDSLCDRVNVCLKHLLVETEKETLDNAVFTVLCIVNGLFLSSSQHLSDMSRLKEADAEWKRQNGGIGKDYDYLANLDVNYANSLIKGRDNGVRIYDLIPSELLDLPELLELRTNIATNYVNCYDNAKRRYSFYGYDFYADTIQVWEKDLDKLVSGLPDETISQIKNSWSNANSSKKKGCAGILAFLLMAGAGVSYGLVELVKNFFI